MRRRLDPRSSPACAAATIGSRGWPGRWPWPRPASLFGQASPSPPSFPAQAEAITVDVVVLDRDGQPVAGLTKEDFTLLDGGRPQPIVGFEERRASTGAGTRAAATEAVPERVGEQHPQRPTRADASSSS